MNEQNRKLVVTKPFERIVTNDKLCHKREFFVWHLRETFARLGLDSFRLAIDFRDGHDTKFLGWCLVAVTSFISTIPIVGLVPVVIFCFLFGLLMPKTSLSGS